MDENKELHGVGSKDGQSNEVQPVTETDRSLGDKKSSQPSFQLSLPVAIVIAGFVIAAAVLFVGKSSPQVVHVPLPSPESFPRIDESYDYDGYSDTEVGEAVIPYQYERQPLAVDTRDYSQYYKKTIIPNGVVWSEPQLMTNLGLLEPREFSYYDADSVSYFQVGTYLERPIIFAELPCDGMLCSIEHAFFIKNNDGSYDFISNASYDPGSEYAEFILVDGVVEDYQTSLFVLPPEKITTNTGVELRALWQPSTVIEGFFSESSFNMSNEYSYEYVDFIEDTVYGPLFRAYTPDTTTGTTDYMYAIRLPGGFYVPYDDGELLRGFMTDDRVPWITWLTGETNVNPYRSDRMTGCGGGGPEVMLEPLREPAVELVGTTARGNAVYNLIDPTHPLITRVFEMTDGIVYEYNEETGEGRSVRITPEQFIGSRGVLLIESSGQQLVLTNTKYGPQAECAKPVIYLYPEATTTVSVSVDALVTKSEPEYEEGWVATAHRDGSLIVNGESYTSLFWDGYGNGIYPELRQGFVVPTRDVLTVMSEHLRFMGFNEIEISEFVAFWSDHLPQEPYTRFSWLQTGEMERLAKLTITPRPDTLIRAFVDYEGIPEMIDLEPQTLIQRARNGYVVTEWGGLLRK